MKVFEVTDLPRWMGTLLVGGTFLDSDFSILLGMEIVKKSGYREGIQHQQTVVADL